MPPAETVVQEMARAIVEAVHPRLIVLFGSRAAGGAGPDSDVDLLVVQEKPFHGDRTRMQETRRIRRALSGFAVPKDILVVSEAELSKWRNSRNHIVARSLREGAVLYERP